MAKRPNVRIFFYGTFMNSRVLGEYGITPQELIPASVDGFTLTIRPRANLEPADSSSVYGTVATLAHVEVNLLYKDLLDRYGLTYLPHRVQAHTSGGIVHVVTYIAAIMNHAQ